MFKEMEIAKLVIEKVCNPIAKALQQLADAQSLNAMQFRRANDIQERIAIALEKREEDELLSTEKAKEPIQ